MARILLAWELGDGLGHINRLLPIAHRLAADGHACLFAVRNLVEPHRLVRQAGFPMLQAPYMHPIAEPSVAKKTMGSLGDVLGAIGFDNPARLGALVDAWTDLLDLAAIDLVIADYSPGLCLACYQTRRIAVIGDGFTLPPADLPEFDRFNPMVEPRVEAALLSATMAAVQEARGRPVPPALPAVFSADAAFAVTLPELDQYHERRGPAAVGTVAALPPPASEPPTEDYFAYLSLTYKGTDTALRGLAATGGRGSIFLRDATPERRDGYRALGLVIHEAPQPIAEAVARAAVLVHHGGMGTAEVGLAIGRPQLLVPRHFEQMTNARVLGRWGVAAAMRMGGNFQVEHILAAWQHVRYDPEVRTSAEARAHDIAARGPSQAVERIAQGCAAILRRDK